MISKKYSELSEQEQKLFISELTHAFTHSDELFKMGMDIISDAKEFGLFERVTFMPTYTTEKNDTNPTK